jgi:TPR repeat protein
MQFNDGRGVPQDCAEAAKWYRLAAEQGNAAAQNNMGNNYYDGDGVLQSNDN